MTSANTNLLQDEKPVKKPQTKKKSFSKFILYCLIFFAVFVGVFSFQVILSGDSITQTFGKINIFQNLGIAITDDKPLKGQEEDRINILLLGMGGEGHPGPYLTDTIMIISVRPSDGKVAMISVPRDLSVPIEGYGWRKINNANHFGEVNDPGNGAEFAAQTISKTFDLPIHYYARVDFAGFKYLIDELGGVDIYVDTAFADYQFPTDNYGYQTVSFEEGWQNMDGQTALNYARSRHGTNGQNSDFARSKRQQKVLEAVKEKASSFTTFLSIRKVSALYDMYKDNVSTNLEPWEMYQFYKISKDIDMSSIKNIVLEIGPDKPLYSTIINEAYLLLPKDMSFKELQQIAANALENPQQQVAAEKIEEPKIEKTKIEVQNGTRINGLASKTSSNLKKEGYKVITIGNAAEQNYEHTVIYDITNGEKEDDLQKLKESLNALTLDSAPDDITYNQTIDFLIILGSDSANLTLDY